MSVNLDHLEFVVAVADHKGFRRASRALNVSQPALSHAVIGLERRLGVQLFSRSGRSIALTPAGQMYVLHAREVLGAVDRLKGSITAAREFQGLRLPVIAHATSVSGTLALLTTAVRRRLPGVTVDITTVESISQLGEHLLVDDFEIGLASRPASAALRSELISEESFKVVLPPGTTPDAAVVDLGRVFSMPWVLLKGWRHLYDLSRDDPRFNPDNEVVVEVDNREVLMLLVLMGVGATILPDLQARVAARSGAVVVSARPDLRRSIYLVSRQGPLSPGAQAFAETARGMAEWGPSARERLMCDSYVFEHDADG